MRARRGVYAAIFLVAALAASALVYLNQPRAAIVRATTDIALFAPISADMVELVAVSPADAPANAARSVDAVVGRYASVPLLAGQEIDLRTLDAVPGQREFGFGAPLGAGQVAFALPVEPGQAIGGALTPGARIDVVAVPNAVKTQLSLGSVAGASSAGGAGAPGGSAAPSADGAGGQGVTGSASAVILGEGLTVLAVRTTDGQPLTDAQPSTRTSVTVTPKLGAVVVGIPAARLADFATAALGSTFYLALSPTVGP